jgi:tripartite ATP-independent transporter DctP family solute receptor
MFGKKKGLMKGIFILTLVVAMILSGCSRKTVSSQETDPSEKEVDKPSKTYELVIAHAGVDGLSWTEAIKKFAELAENYSNGQLKFKIYGASQLGSQKQMLESMQLGTVDMTYAFEPLAMWLPEINAYSLPYLFNDMEHLKRVEDSEVGQKIKDKLIEKAGMRVVMSYLREGRQLTTNKPVNSISDIKGLKIRVTESAAVVKSWEALGTKPVPLAMSEVFSALQQGVIDGQENPLSIIDKQKITEVNKYIAMTNHQFSPVWVMISEQKYQSLPKELQDVIQKAAKEAEDYERTLAEKEWEEVKKKVEEAKVTFTYPDVTEFEEAVKDIYKQFPELIPYVEAIKSMK